MAVNLEDAGFEVRDIVAWVYGSGFPKSLDIGKAIDKAAGAEREVVGFTNRHTTKQKQSGASFNLTDHQVDPESGKTYATAPATEAAKQWDGWGTALKPSIELWTLCRKPLAEKTIAENVLTWGTGGLNIDGCRIDGDMGKDRALGKPRRTDNDKFGKANENINPQSPLGRFPANLITDGSDEVTAGFPQSNSSKPSESVQYGKDGGKGKKGVVSFTNSAQPNQPPFADSGSAARFFYCAKASKSERNAGLEGFDKKEPPASARSNPAEGKKNALGEPRENHHPTVKPLALMRYLCRLITPPNGIVLDPFTGSGSTGCGAIWEGFNFIGIERESDYAAIAQARITHAQKEKAADAASAQTNLF